MLVPLRGSSTHFSVALRNLRPCFQPRTYATALPYSGISPVELAFDSYIPPNGNEKEGPLVILHGLLGSKRNWQSLCKAFSKDLNRPVYALDLRNHGSSPHTAPHTYPALAADVRHFISSHSLTNVQLLGHSMGGKVAMAVALSEQDQGPTSVEKLVVADIAPSIGKLSNEFVTYVRQMQEVDAKGVKTRKEAQAIMSEVEKDPSVLAFLLTNLASGPDKTLKFRLPTDILIEAMPEIGSFPYKPGERTWEGPTMLVKGANSNFINRKNLPTAQQLFPKMQLETLDAGHWVHAERPNEFKALLANFVGRL